MAANENQTHDKVHLHKKSGVIQKIDISLNLIVFENNGTWVAYAPNIKTFGYSDEGEKEAINDFSQALRTFFDVHGDSNSIEPALKAFGWKNKRHRTKDYISPEIPSHQLDRGQIFSTSIAA